MEKLRNKLKDYGGFTLIEMLIVVAIIAILIAISIPLISATLERAREAVDDANERSAVSLGYAKYLTATEAEAKEYAKTNGKSYYYKITSSPAQSAASGATNTTHQGSLVEFNDTNKPDPYGKGLDKLGNVMQDRRSMVIKVTICDKDITAETDAVVKVEWVEGKTS